MFGMGKQEASRRSAPDRRRHGACAANPLHDGLRIDGEVTAM
jgi:hypothetical protein